MSDGVPAILHCDVDAFYAAVEQRDDPRLRRRPVAVGSWVVMAASYEAKACGVRSGSPTSRARRACPDLIVVEPRWSAYVEASRAVFAILERSAPSVERGSMEEAFLDLRGRAPRVGMPAPALLAARLRTEIRDQVGLAISIGVARTKILAKLASKAAKPDGLLVVAPDGELGFLHPLALGDVWGIGPATARRLGDRGLRTVADAAAVAEEDLVAMLGPAAGRYVHAVSRGRDPRPVQRRRGRRSFGAQRALGRRPRRAEELDEVLAALAGRIATRMQKAGRSGRTVVLRLRFSDMQRATRSTTLVHGTAATDPILTAARTLLQAATPLAGARRITLLGITVTNLDGPGSAHQLVLDIDA